MSEFTQSALTVFLALRINTSNKIVYIYVVCIAENWEIDGLLQGLLDGLRPLPGVGIANLSWSAVDIGYKFYLLSTLTRNDIGSLLALDEPRVCSYSTTSR
jgi:hypothetical protein